MVCSYLGIHHITIILLLAYHKHNYVQQLLQIARLATYSIDILVSLYAIPKVATSNLTIYLYYNFPNRKSSYWGDVWKRNMGLKMGYLLLPWMFWQNNSCSFSWLQLLYTMWAGMYSRKDMILWLETTANSLADLQSLKPLTDTCVSLMLGFKDWINNELHTMYLKISVHEGIQTGWVYIAWIISSKTNYPCMMHILWYMMYHQWPSLPTSLLYNFLP